MITTARQTKWECITTDTCFTNLDSSNLSATLKSLLTSSFSKGHRKQQPKYKIEQTSKFSN